MDKDKLKRMGVLTATYVGGAFISGLAYIGDRLGLFKAMAGAGELTSEELARKTGLNERYVREWLKAMTAAEYCDYDAGSDRYAMSEEAATVLADEDGPIFLAGMYQMTVPHLMLTPKVMETFRNGGGIKFSEMGEEIIDSIDRLHKSPFTHLLAQKWLPQVPGLKEKLAAGIAVLDVGCGLGRSTVAIASAYPNSRVAGLEPDPFSCEGARKMATDAGVRNTEYLQTPIMELPPGSRYDLVLALDCIHDMVDPIGGLKAIREALADDGLFFWMEPIGSANPMENRNPASKLRQAISPYHCMSVSLASGGAGLGTLIGEAGARELAGQAGFSHFEKLPIEDPGQQFFAVRR